jgi:hypothetical protein
MYIIAPEPISTAYFINPFHQSVCLYVYPALSLLGNGSTDTFLLQRNKYRRTTGKVMPNCAVEPTLSHIFTTQFGRLQTCSGCGRRFREWEDRNVE